MAKAGTLMERAEKRERREIQKRLVCFLFTIYFWPYWQARPDSQAWASPIGKQS